MATVTVVCPQCSSRYLLPVHLMGAGGTRVRCPACGASFEVPPATDDEAPEATLETEPAPVAPAAARDPGAQWEIANATLDRLAPEAETMRESHARGRLLAEHGPRMLEAFDAFRRAAGPEADAGVFREALRARWGLELPSF